MLLLQNPSHPYFRPLVEGAEVGLPDSFGKFLDGEFHLLQADWGFAFDSAQVRRIVGLIICIIFVIRNLWSWRHIGNPCNICPPHFPGLLESFRWEANEGSPRCARKLSWCSGGGQSRPNGWIVLRRCWRYLSCTWRWRPMSCESLRGEHLRSTITALGEIICLPRRSITRISLGCSRAWVWAWCHVELAMVVELWSTWKCWLRRLVTISRWRINLICGFPKLSIFAWCISSMIIWCLQIVIWALLWAQQPTSWSHIGCLLRITIRRHRMCTQGQS